MYEVCKSHIFIEKPEDSRTIYNTARSYTWIIYLYTRVMIIIVIIK